jgi:hypothetical protein
MGDIDNPGKAVGLLSVMVTPEDIKNGKLLVGRYDIDTERLTELRTINSRAVVPPTNDHAAYRLIGIAADLANGQPLNEFIDEYVKGWDGLTPITLFFNAQGIFDHWASTATAKGAA